MKSFRIVLTVFRNTKRIPRRAVRPIATGLAFALAGCATAPPAVGPSVSGASATAARTEAASHDPDAVERETGTPPSGIRIFRGDGTPTSWDDLIEAALATQVLLLGEMHDDRIGHEMRHALTERLIGETCAPHVISLEMLESDVQLVVDEYQAGIITQDHFMRASRPWNNHAQDYEPYLEEARRCNLPVVAANPPRRYVNRVARMGSAGLDGLDGRALELLPPLPVEPPSLRYRAAWNALMGGGAGGHGHGGNASEDPVLKAQNLWDAGMAWAVSEALNRHPEARVIHVAGAFHVQDNTGIPEHLARYAPDARSLIVVAYPVDPSMPFDPEAHGGKGDFVVLTYRP